MTDSAGAHITTTADRLPIGLLAAAGFLSMSGARIMDPLLAVVAQEFGVSVPAASVVIAAFTLPYGLNQVILGPLGDRFGKLRMILITLGGLTLFTTLCATAGNLTMLVVFRALAGAMGGGIIPASMAYIGDAVPYEHRQIAISRYMFGNVMGLTLAGPIGGILGEFVGWQGVFLTHAAGGLLVCLLLGRRLRDLPDQRHAGSTQGLSNYLVLARRPAARILLLAVMFEGTVTVGAFPFLAPFLHEAFGLSHSLVGLILSCFGIGAFLYTRVAPRLLPRLGEIGCVLLGGFMMTASLVLATVLPGWGGFVGLEMALGCGFYLLHGVLQTRATELLPNARSTAVASFAFVLFVGQSAGALILAAWIAAAGYRTALLADGVFVAIVAIGLRWALRRGER